jgi:type II secretory pathway component GspD/PulD (secretin)
MKRFSILIAAATAAIGFATAVQAAPKKVIESDIRVYTIDTYKSDREVASILSKAFGHNVVAGINGGGTVFLGTKANVATDNVFKALRKVGKPEAPFTAKINTRSGKEVPLSVGQTLELADGSINGKAKTRDLETGVFMKTTPTSLKNGDIKVAYELKLVDLIDLKHKSFAGSKIDLATVHEQAVGGNARLDKGSSLILAGFSKDGPKGFFGRKNRVVVSVVTPRHL